MKASFNSEARVGRGRKSEFFLGYKIHYSCDWNSELPTAYQGGPQTRTRRGTLPAKSRNLQRTKAKASLKRHSRHHSPANPHFRYILARTNSYFIIKRED